MLSSLTPSHTTHFTQRESAILFSLSSPPPSPLLPLPAKQVTSFIPSPVQQDALPTVCWGSPWGHMQHFALTLWVGVQYRRQECKCSSRPAGWLKQSLKISCYVLSFRLFPLIAMDLTILNAYQSNEYLRYLWSSHLTCLAYTSILTKYSEFNYFKKNSELSEVLQNTRADT